MLNYQSIIKAIKSGKLVDLSDHFMPLLQYRYVSFENCKGTSESLLMRCLACFLDESINSIDSFKSLKVGNHEDFIREVNGYCVLWLDFSDFEAGNFEDAIGYLKDKMSSAYKCYFKYFQPEANRYYDYMSLEYALEVIERKCPIEELQHSMKRLVYRLRDYKYKQDNFRLAILVDNLVKLEVVAENEGYDGRMKEFLIKFVVEDIYKHCDFFMQIGDSKENYDSWLYIHQYIAYRYWGVITSDLKERYPELVMSENEQCPFTDLNDIPDGYDWDSRIQECRIEIKNAKLEEERRKQELIRYEKNRFAEELLPEVPHLSFNMGIRGKKLNKSSHKYKELTKILRKVYMVAYPKFKENEIYKHLLKLNEKERIINNEKQCEADLESLTGKKSNWENPSVNLSSGHWAQVIFRHTREEAGVSPVQPGNIKVYASFKTTNILEIFYNSLRYLLSHANNTFAAKIAFYNRSDQMCYWLSPTDFKHLEDFYQPYSQDMKKPMSFIAYKGMLGISKDFPGADCSHNSLQAHIVSDYMKTIANISEVDLEAMYNNYIAKWNADIYEGNDYCGFKNCSALSFIVVLDTLDIILGDTELSNSSLLLSDNKEFWDVLSRSKCWADVNAKISKINSSNIW